MIGSVARERFLITGASGQLGGHVVRLLSRDSASPDVQGLCGGRAPATPGAIIRSLDLADFDGLRRAILEARPTHIVHLGAMTAVSDCHARPEQARRVNTDATIRIAAVAAELGARCVFASTDMVFDGRSAPYAETDVPDPLSVYGRTKAAAEDAIRGFPRVLSVRIPLLFGLPATPRETTFTRQVAALRAGEPLRLFVDEYRTPIWLGDAARALIGLARSDFCGLIHVAGPVRLSRIELIEACAALLEIERPNLVPISRNDIAAAEPRPADLSLDGRRFVQAFPNLSPGPMSDTVFMEAGD